MKLIIDIPEEDYIMYKEWVVDKCANIEQAIIANGTPLPKGHGRLIDADDVDNHIVGSVDLRGCPTIVEADKENSDEASN